MREVTLKLPQRKGIYEEALADTLENEEVYGDQAEALRELIAALREA